MNQDILLQIEYYRSHNYTYRKISKMLNITTATVYNYLKEKGTK